MSELIQTVARIRRAMPRNVDVMSLCEDWDRLRLKVSELEAAGKLVNMLNARAPTDRKTYMREYMRRKRAKK